MDEQKLADLFRDAATDAPPASFDAGDVRTASRRATLRRRNSIAAGTTLVVVLGFGGVAAGAGWFGTNTSGSNNLGSAQQQEGTGADAPITPLEAQPPPKNNPGDASTQGDASKPGSTGLATSAQRAVQGCAAVDRELADALAGELSVPSELAVLPAESCSPQSRAASFKIDGLTVTAIVTPDSFEVPSGAQAEKKKAASGQDLYVYTQGDGELKGKARPIAEALAPRF
ncbi:hypothetical protein [Lentzea sp. NPDC051838]|uniref:hypothetical protein n=1 Tax=Lentzea sp. NPDC051838 TaxID=3154849 RepID=UPI003447E400